MIEEQEPEATWRGKAASTQGSAQQVGAVEVGRAGRARGPRSQRVAPNPKSRIQNPKSQTENRKPKIENRKLKIEKRKAKLENGNRKLENGKSKTQNRQSSIVNLQLPQPPTPQPPSPGCRRLYDPQGLWSRVERPTKGGIALPGS